MGDRSDEPVTLAPEAGPVCAYCLVDHGQPEDIDFAQLGAIRDLLGIRTDARLYAGYYKGAELHRRLRGWQVETWSVAFDAVGPQLRHPWGQRLPRSTVPGIVIRYRLWKPRVGSHLVLWWDPRTAKPRVDFRDPDQALPSDWDNVRAFVERLMDNRPMGRPRGSGTFADAEEFETTVLTVIEELLQQGRTPTQDVVAEHLSSRLPVRPHSEHGTSDRQLRAWCTRFGHRFQDLVERARAEVQRS